MGKGDSSSYWMYAGEVLSHEDGNTYKAYFKVEPVEEGTRIFWSNSESGDPFPQSAKLKSQIMDRVDYDDKLMKNWGSLWDYEKNDWRSKKQEDGRIIREWELNKIWAEASVQATLQENSRKAPELTNPTTHKVERKKKSQQWTVVPPNETAEAGRLENIKDAFTTYNSDPRYVISRFMEGVLIADERIRTTGFTLIDILESAYLAIGKKVDRYAMLACSEDVVQRKVNRPTKSKNWRKPKQISEKSASCSS